MNKKIISTLSILAAFLCCNVSYAQETTSAEVDKKLEMSQPEKCPFALEKHKNIHKNFQHKMVKPSKQEMEAKKQEFEKRLNLTEDQKKKIEKNREKDHQKVKPLFEDMKAKKQEIRKIQSNSSLSEKDKEKKINKLNSQITDIKTKLDKYRQENMQNFESILTDEQKQEFIKIKEEQKQIMEKRRQEFEFNKKYGLKHKHFKSQPVEM